MATKTDTKNMPSKKWSAYVHLILHCQAGLHNQREQPRDERCASDSGTRSRLAKGNVRHCKDKESYDKDKMGDDEDRNVLRTGGATTRVIATLDL